MQFFRAQRSPAIGAACTHRRATLRQRLRLTPTDRHRCCHPSLAADQLPRQDKCEAKQRRGRGGKRRHRTTLGERWLGRGVRAGHDRRARRHGAHIVTGARVAIAREIRFKQVAICLRFTLKRPQFDLGIALAGSLRLRFLEAVAQ
jgi:hypothetical protein